MQSAPHVNTGFRTEGLLAETGGENIDVGANASIKKETDANDCAGGSTESVTAPPVAPDGDSHPAEKATEDVTSPPEALSLSDKYFLRALEELRRGQNVDAIHQNAAVFNHQQQHRLEEAQR